MVSGSGLCLLGAPETIRTSDSRIRNPVLYPLSYGGNPSVSIDREAIDIISVNKWQVWIWVILPGLS